MKVFNSREFSMSGWSFSWISNNLWLIHLVFVQHVKFKCLSYFGNTNKSFFRTFCHLTTTCVVYSTLKNPVGLDMERTREHLPAIIFHNFRGRLSQVCSHEYNSLYGEKAPPYSTAKNWYTEFKGSRHSLQEEFSEGRPKSVVVPKNNDADHVATTALEQSRTFNSNWYTNIRLSEVIGEIWKKRKERRIILYWWVIHRAAHLISLNFVISSFRSLIFVLIWYF